MPISYASAIAELSRPTAPQIADFVEYVATAHSWYKHLPLLPPGLPFMFYLDPNAGREWIEDGSSSGYRDRLVDAPQRERFHYTWQPTSDYIRRFGYLTYFADAGTSFRVPVKNGVLVTASLPRIQDTKRRWRGAQRSWIPVPDDVRVAGTVYLTGVIHPAAQCMYAWVLQQHLADTYRVTDVDILAYDDASVDETAKNAIRLVQRVLRTPKDVADLAELEELESRVLPAWADIQKRQMNQAIHLMLDCIRRPGGLGTAPS